MTPIETAQLLLSKDNFLIITHKNPDGDTLGSSAALCRSLRACGKKAFLYDNKSISEKFMPYLTEYIIHEDFDADFIVSVDVADTTMFCPGFSGHIDLAIDHHVANPGFGDYNCIYSEKSACGEIITEIIENFPSGIDEVTATLLYIAVTTDTGAFMYLNTNADTFSCCSRLLKYGADMQEVNTVFFRKVSKPRIALEGLIYSGFEYYHNAEVVISVVTLEDMKRCEATNNDIDDLAGLPGRVDSEKIGVTIREIEEGISKVSVRTVPEYNACEICQAFGGGGHVMASGCTIHENPETAKQLILSEIDKFF